MPEGTVAGGVAPEGARSGAQLGLATLAFFVNFAVWGSIAAFAPRFRDQFHLSGTATSLLVAVPVLLGSLARLPMGFLADRFGGRIVFAAATFAVALPVLLVPAATSFAGLLAVAFFVGVAGATFPIGVSHVSRWTPPERQGSALGVYGVGNLGQSAAVFLGPLAAAAFGLPAVFRALALLLVAWGLVWSFAARDAPRRGAPATLAALGRVLRRREAWALSFFYFLTFGGFVAFGIYLPLLLRDDFGLSLADAGFRTAGFVLVATLLRPVGGLFADRIGGARLLAGVFAALVPFALLLAWKSIVPFTVGALGSAALLGLGNGAVFKLVPGAFPEDTGTATGLVGAMGGLGGFFPPLLLGLFRDRFGVVWPGFVLLAAVALALGAVNRRLFLPADLEREIALPPHLRRAADRLRAGAIASAWTALLVAAIVVGSRKLQNFDPALVVYTFAVVFATWGVVYHYAVWLQKPPTRVYWRSGWELVRRRGLASSVVRLAALAGSHLVGQTFIRRRSPLRFWMHQLIFWGCLLAAAITFPLVFGWIHFRTPLDDDHTYIAYLFGFPVGRFPVDSALAWLAFHGLDVAAVLVLGGLALSLWRRLRDRGAQSVQQFGMDLFPIFLLFAISVTGLALTVSVTWLRGSLYPFLAILHAVTVVAALLYLPFGKLFHVFQRPAQLGVKLYQDAGDADEGTHCRRCGERFASRRQIADLEAILPELGFDYSYDDGRAHWQRLCPACKRKSLATAQMRLKENPGVPSPPA